MGGVIRRRFIRRGSRRMQIVGIYVWRVRIFRQKSYCPFITFFWMILRERLGDWHRKICFRWGRRLSYSLLRV